MTKYYSKDLIILTLIISLLLGVALGAFPLEVPDAARYAEIPREMVVSGDYLTPHLNAVKYLEKPPLFYWMQALNIKMFGTSVFAVTLANAAMALICCLLIYIAGSKLYGRRSGFLASLILAISPLFFAMTHVVTLDMTLTTFLTAALLFFILGNNEPPGKVRNNYMWAMYASVALAVMTKGLIGIVFPGIIIFIWLVVNKEWHSIKTYCIFSGILLFLLIAAPWHILVQLKNPEFFKFYFLEQHFLRYLTPYASREQPWWFFPVVFVGGFYPWIAFAVQAIRYHFPAHWRERFNSKTSMFLIIWAVTIFIFYSFSDSKLIPYILPVLPPLALLVGDHIASCWQQKHEKSCVIGFNAAIIINIALGSFFLFVLPFVNQQKITLMISEIHILSILMVLSGAITAVFYWCKGTAKGFVALLVTMSLFLLGAKPIIMEINQKSIMPLAIYLKARLKPQDEVVSFKNYYQDLPYYLGRCVTVVDYRGELLFGTEHQAESKGWMIDQKTFWQRWRSGKRMYMITNLSDYDSLPSDLRATTYPLAKYLDKRILVTNIKPNGGW